jgi:hypothetical protein
MLIVDGTNIDGSIHAASMREHATISIRKENKDRRMMHPPVCIVDWLAADETRPRDRRRYQRAGAQAVTEPQQRREIRCPTCRCDC